MLVGRDALLAAGDEAVRATLVGHGRLVLLAGEAGIGKSMLAQAFADRARAAGATVRVGACWETEGLPPFTPWLDALRRPGADACAEVAERLAAGDETATDAASAQRARARLFGEVADALYAVSERRPQMVVLEDLHWADAPSLELLAALAPHLRAMAVLVVATFRDDEMPRPNPLPVGGGAERLTVDGVDAAAVAEIVATVTGQALDDAANAALAERTGGNPLFVTQVARLLDAGSDALPLGVQDVLERRLARLSSDCVRVLGAAAVLGHEFDLTELAALVDGDVAGALDEARAARLVEACDGEPMRWRFVHALVQATRYAGLSARERDVLHRAAIDALRGRPGVAASTLAHHAARAPFAPGDATAAELFVGAGQEALAGLSWIEATAAFERALAVAPDGDAGAEVRAEAWLGIGACRLRQDRPDVRDAFDEVAQLARRLGRPDLLARAALGFGVGLGAFEVRLLDHAQIDLLEQAAVALDEDDPLLPLVLARLSVALAFTGAEERRAELAMRAIDLARRAGQEVVLGHALAARCDAFAGPEHIADRLAASQEIVTLATRHGDLPLELLGRRLRVVALFESLQLHDVDREIVLYERAAEGLGDPAYTWFPSLWRAARALSRGEVDDARRLTDEATAIGAQGGSQNSTMLGHVVDFIAGVERRDRVAAETGMQAMVSLMPHTLSEYFVLSDAYVAARLGDLDRARAHLANLDGEVLDRLPRDSEWVCWLVQLESTAALTGDLGLSAVTHAALLPLAGSGAIEGIGAYCHGATDRYLAMGAAAAGDAAATRRHVEDAIRLVGGGGELLGALTALDGAWALRRAGDPDDGAWAEALAVGAEAVFAPLGLEALAAEAASLARAGSSAPVSAPSSTHEPASPRLLRQGDTWAVTWEGTTVHAKQAKGIADLAVLLERPGREVHVRELDGGPALATATDAQTVLDDTAVQQYRQRLADLDDDLDEAVRHRDAERAAHLEVERDALVAELSRAFGLGGRGRRLGSDPDERLRKAVSARVKASIERLEDLHPALGRHLRASVRTGFFCSYAPERPTTWSITR